MSNPNLLTIQLLPNQQFIFEPEEPNCKIDETQYCQLVSNGDSIQIQQKLLFVDECTPNLICTPELGSDLVTDGNFPDLANWTEDVNWTAVSGTACSDGTSGTLSQNIGVVNGTPYYVTFDLVAVSGDLYVDLGGAALGGSPFSVSGSYAYVVVAGASGLIQFDADTFEGCIDNVTVQEILCWDTTGWLYTPETSFCNSTGNGVALQTLDNITIDCGTATFELIVTIENLTDGSITASINANPFPTISSNGTHTVYMTGTAGAPLVLTPTTDFNGCITDVQLRAMCDYPQLALFTADNDLWCYLSEDGGTDIDITQDRITWSFALNLLECSVPYGCYMFKIADQCNDCFVTDTLVTNGTFTSDIANWTTGGFFAWASGVAATSQTDFIYQDLGVNRWMCVRFEVVSLSGTGSPFVSLGIKPTGGGTNYSSVVAYTAGVYTLFGYGGQLYFSAIGATINASIDNIYAIETSQDESLACGKYCYQVRSNCLNYRLSHDCTKYFSADCDENSLGFVFATTLGNPVFDIRARLRTVTFAPTHPKKRNVVLDSSGSKKLLFSESEKVYQCRFDYCDDITHDTISTMLECDNIEVNHGSVDGNPLDYDLIKNYISLTEDYIPEWDSKGQRNLSQSQVEIREVQSTIFNQNLG